MHNNKYIFVIFVIIIIILVASKGSDASLLSSIRRMMITKPPISPSPAPDIDSTTLKPNSSSGETIDERCEASTNCVKNMMTACIKNSTTGPRDYIILIQNEGEGELIVKVAVPDYVQVSTKELKIVGYQVKKVNASIPVGKSVDILVNAGDGACVFHIGGVSVLPKVNNLFQNYANQATPIHGAYFMFVVVVIMGGTWACCKLGKKGYSGGGEHQYEEIEMALPESTRGAQDGWEQGWDDDWDEEPSKGAGDPSSSNGLTSRSLNKEDGWENDWDS